MPRSIAACEATANPRGSSRTGPLVGLPPTSAMTTPADTPATVRKIRSGCPGTGHGSESYRDHMADVLEPSRRPCLYRSTVNRTPRSMQPSLRMGSGRQARFYASLRRFVLEWN